MSLSFFFLQTAGFLQKKIGVYFYNSLSRKAFRGSVLVHQVIDFSYNGVNCSYTCPYQFYGVECQQSCNCMKDLCDVSTGCTSYNKGQHLKMLDIFLKIEKAVYRFTLNKTYLFSYLECKPGYSGMNCSIPCRYPLYGVECQKSCNCVKDLCDVSVGCQQTTTGS